MKNSTINIARLSGLVAIGLATFAGATAMSASRADAREYILHVPVSGASLLPGTLTRVSVACLLGYGEGLDVRLVSIGVRSFQIPATSTEFSTTITFTETSDVIYIRYQCKIIGFSPNIVGPREFGVNADEPFKSHPGSVILIQENF